MGEYPTYSGFGQGLTVLVQLDPTTTLRKGGMLAACEENDIHLIYI